MDKYRSIGGAVLLVCLVLGVILWLKLTAWKTFDGRIEGTRIEGDAKASPTRWYNHWYLAWRGWKTVVVFEADTGGEYFYGYKPFRGDPQVSITAGAAKRFRLKIGHESCTFFAIDGSGKEVALKVVARTTVNDPQYADVPLY